MEEYLNLKDYITVESIFNHNGIQERLKGYNTDPNFYPKCSWLNRNIPTRQSILETVALMRAKQLKASIILPSRDEEKTIGKTIEQINFFNDFNIGNIEVYDNSSFDNTRKIVQSMNISLFKAEQYGLLYNIPDYIFHKGTNMWFSIINNLRITKNSSKHIIIFVDTDVGLSIIEIMQILHVFAEKPNTKLILPFIKRLTKRGDENGEYLIGGRVSQFTWGPIRDTLLSPYIPDIIEHPSQLAGIYGVNLEFLSNIELPHGYGIEVAIQTEAYIYAYINKLNINNIIQFVPCGIYSQLGQNDNNIRFMSYDITNEFIYRMNLFKILLLSFHLFNINIDQYQSNIQKLINIYLENILIDIPQPLLEAKHIKMKKNILIDYISNIENQNIHNPNYQKIYRFIYYLPSPKQFLKEYINKNQSLALIQYNQK